MQFASNYKRRCLSSSFSRTVTRERRRGGALLMILTIKYSGPDGRVFGGTRDSEQRVSILFSLAARESSFFSSFFFSLMYAARAARRGKVVDVTWGCLKKKKKRKKAASTLLFGRDFLFPRDSCFSLSSSLFFPLPPPFNLLPSLFFIFSIFISPYIPSFCTSPGLILGVRVNSLHGIKVHSRRWCPVAKLPDAATK